jgi:acyl carrier protein
VALDVTPTSLSFLELGLDSLFLTRWARSLRELFGVPVSLRQLLETEQTLEALATYMVQHMERSDPGHAVSREAGKGAEIDRLVRRLDELTAQLDELRGPAPSGPEAPVETVAPHAQPALDPRRPPLPGARLGRAADGQRAWFVPDPARAGRYLQVDLESEAGS